VLSGTRVKLSWHVPAVEISPPPLLGSLNQTVADGPASERGFQKRLPPDGSVCVLEWAWREPAVIVNEALGPVSLPYRKASIDALPRHLRRFASIG
jgi:hypothetical protein